MRDLSLDAVKLDSNQHLGYFFRISRKVRNLIYLFIANVIRLVLMFMRLDSPSQCDSCNILNRDDIDLMLALTVGVLNKFAKATRFVGNVLYT